MSDSKANTRLRIGSRVYVKGHGKGKIIRLSNEKRVIEVELDKGGGYVTAAVSAVKRMEDAR